MGSEHGRAGGAALLVVAIALPFLPSAPCGSRACALSVLTALREGRT